VCVCAKTPSLFIVILEMALMKFCETFFFQSPASFLEEVQAHEQANAALAAIHSNGKVPGTS